VTEQQPDDAMSVGQGFLRDMDAQTRRARAFDRRLQWARLRRLIPPPDAVVLPDTGQPTIDLTATAERAVPRQRD
jgi:hypothetical protein